MTEIGTGVLVFIKKYGWLFLVSFAFALVRAYYMPSRRGLRDHIIVILVSIMIGIMGGLIATEWGYGNFTALGVTALGTMFANTLLIFAGAVHRRLSTEPDEVVDEVWRYLKRRAGAETEYGKRIRTRRT